MSKQAFLPAPALPQRITRPSTHVTTRPMCCARSRPRVVKHLQTLSAAAAAALIGGCVFVRPPAVRASPPPTAARSAKELRYDGRQELEGGEKAMSLTLTAGTFAALSVWAWKQNRRDDELENIRIKEEVERLEKIKAEFIDVEEDEGGLDDEDLLASLKQRISDGEEDDEEASEDAEDDAGTVALEDGAEQVSNVSEEEESDSADSTDANSLDMLQRMWDATDDSNKDANKS